jgi:transposase
MTAEETIASLEAQLKQALERIDEVTEQLRVAQARIEELEKLKTPPPAFVKAKKKKPPEEQKKARKKRDAKHNRARPRSEPTQIVEHRLVTCPTCQLRLGGISLARCREVIDVPVPPPVEVTEHRIYKGWCAECQHWYETPVDVHEQVVGQGRIGVRLASLIATLRTVMRLPIRQIQAYLLTLHGVRISSGEIVELLHRIKAQMQPHLDALKREIRASPAVQADETGWREDGTNGYIWSVSTPDSRYFEYHHSRGGEVVKELIGKDFGGVLESRLLCRLQQLSGLASTRFGCISYAMGMSSKRSIRAMSNSSAGLPPSKPSMNKRWPGPSRVLTRTSQHANSSRCAWRSSMPSSSSCSLSAAPTWGPPPLNIPYVNGLNAFCPNSLSLSRCLVFQPTTIWPSAAFAHAYNTD